MDVCHVFNFVPRKIITPELDGQHHVCRSQRVWCLESRCSLDSMQRQLNGKLNQIISHFVNLLKNSRILAGYCRQRLATNHWLYNGKV